MQRGLSATPAGILYDAVASVRSETEASATDRVNILNFCFDHLSLSSLHSTMPGSRDEQAPQLEMLSDHPDIPETEKVVPGKPGHSFFIGFAAGICSGWVYLGHV